MHTDFDTVNDKGFFCMKLAAFIMKYKADYFAEMKNAKEGNCSYKSKCEVYKRTIKKYGGIQLKINF